MSSRASRVNGRSQLSRSISSRQSAERRPQGLAATARQEGARHGAASNRAGPGGGDRLRRAPRHPPHTVRQQRPTTRRRAEGARDVATLGTGGTGAGRAR
jgi:hypothetical protein